MNEKKIYPKRSSTLGKLSTEYQVEVKTLMAMIQPYTELYDKINLHLVGCIRKGQKILPPVVINAIYDTLGEP